MYTILILSIHFYLQFLSRGGVLRLFGMVHPFFSLTAYNYCKCPVEKRWTPSQKGICNFRAQQIPSFSVILHSF